jgi:hypothetical protein
MYLRKASLDQRPRSMIVNTGTPARNIAIAAPLLAECSPICFAVNPRISGPIAVVAIQSCFNNSGPVKRCRLPFCNRNVFTGVSLLEDG